MILRGTDYGSVWGASGVQGFGGEGYPYHKILRLLFGSKFSFKGTTFVAKTVTINRTEGNMPLKADGVTPKEWNPKCIAVNFKKAAVLNAVGLSNFGARFYLENMLWQERNDPFCLSFMAISKTKEERIAELRDFIRLFRTEDDIGTWFAKFALQINFSCPNVGHDPSILLGEVKEFLDISAELPVPKIPKINVLVPPEAAVEIAKHPQCDAICVTNTIPWGKFPEEINWQGLFGKESPLRRRGLSQDGGLSGAPIFPFTLDWVKRACALNIGKPIIAGGGITHPNDVLQLQKAGADAVSPVGSVVMLRPWRLSEIIRGATHIYKYPEVGINFVEQRIRNAFHDKLIKDVILRH